MSMRSFCGSSALVLLAGCAQPVDDARSTATATASPVAERRLSERDLRAYLSVRGRALDRLEAALSGVAEERQKILSEIEDLGSAEREAARALGVDWSDYAWVRDELGRVMALQRQHEDARILALELQRTREDLAEQHEQVRDDASRQFLAAQLASIDERLASLEEDRRRSSQQGEPLGAIDEVRAELAMLQGRHDRILRRMRELLQGARAAEAARVLPTPSIAAP